MSNFIPIYVFGYNNANTSDHYTILSYYPVIDLPHWKFLKKTLIQNKVLEVMEK